MKKEPKYIDIHSHVNFKAFDEDRDEVMKRALENDTWVINVGTQIDTSRKAVEMISEYPEGVYAIIGLHPIHTGASYHDEKELGSAFAKASDGQGGAEGFTSRGEVFDKDAYRELLKNPKVLGIGECGLDYYRMDEESVSKQKKTLIEQIELANEIDKPIMLHIRNNQKQELITGKEGVPNAYFDALDILKEHWKGRKENKGDVHFFAGGLAEAKAFLDFGFTLSFTGVITFTTDYDEVIKNTPLDMIMTETDCPYVTPVPHRGKRNEPVYVGEVVKKIALIKGLSEDEAARAIIANAKRVFGI
jgi:TatD DNase family protein